MSLLIKNVLLNGKKQDVLIENNKISQLGSLKVSSEKIIDGAGQALLPGLVNGHTHAAMTLLRGYADDMPLQAWLETKIWPIEAKLTEDDVYWGSKLACLEMIKSGTTMFFDMYHQPLGTARAARDMGLRSLVTSVYFDKFEKNWENRKKTIAEEIKKIKALNCPWVQVGLGPHAPYTMTEAGLRWTKEFADKNDLLIHFHLSETKKEVDDCLKEHGLRPVEYLEKIGFLGPNLVAVHAVWLSDQEIEILAQHHVKVIYNPASNMKLGSGVFNYEKLKKAGIMMGLGTDGCSSNNSLTMFESMKIGTLLQKVNFGPTVMPAAETLALATHGQIFGLNYGLKEGALADLILIDLKKAFLTPNHNLTSNLVYAANSSCVNTVIVNGRVLMEKGHVPGEEEILEKAGQVAKSLISR